MNSGEPYRVLFVIPFIGEASGWSTAYKGIVDSIAATGSVEATLAVGDEDVPSARSVFPDLPILNLPSIHRANYSHPRNWFAAARASLAARFDRGAASRFDLVHSLEAYPAGWLGHLFARSQRVPHVITALGTYSVQWSRANPLDRWLYRRALAGASCVSAISNATLERLLEGLGVGFPIAASGVVLLGIDSHPDDASSDAVGISDAPVLLTVGAVKRRKGQDVSLRAFFRVRRQYPNAQYRVVGKIADPAFFDELQALLAEHGSRGVTFLGPVSDEELLRQYRAASVFVLTSRDVGEKFEGFGLAPVEAGRFSVPVVATEAGGLSEAVRDGVTGLIVRAEDPDAVALAIMRLLGDPELARSLGRANHVWAGELSWSRYGREQLEVYEQYLARCSARS